jgi:hypothetical protein
MLDNYTDDQETGSVETLRGWRVALLADAASVEADSVAELYW